MSIPISQRIINSYRYTMRSDEVDIVNLLDTFFFSFSLFGDSAKVSSLMRRQLVLHAVRLCDMILK